MKQLVNWVLDGQNAWARMEKMTGVKAIRWRQFCAGIKNATPEMIEALAATWPQYAFWMATGISDEDAGHLAPASLYFPGKLRGGEPLLEEQDATTTYLKACQQAAETLWSHQNSTGKEKPPAPGAILYEDENRSKKGLGHWLRRQSAKPESEEIAEVIRKLMQQQRLHREEMLRRIRHNEDADAIIDNLRKEEEAIKRQFGLTD